MRTRGPRSAILRAALLGLVLAGVVGAGLFLRAPAPSAAWAPEPGAVHLWRSHSPDVLFTYLDDGAMADAAELHQAVRVEEVDDQEARISLRLALRVPALGEHPAGGSVKYFGQEKVERAQAGDFSFVERLPLTAAQRDAARIIPHDEGSGNAVVEIPGPFVVERTLDVRVTRGGEAFLADGTPLGRWALWLPEGETGAPPSNVTLLTHAPLGPLGAAVHAVDEDARTGATRALHEKFPTVDEWISAGTEVAFFRPEGRVDKDRIGAPFAYAYRKDGLLLASLSATYADDVVRKELGVVLMSSSPAASVMTLAG